jgi:predicted acylesterase/phospholipase RssA
LGEFTKPALAITATEVEGGRIRVFSPLTAKTDATLNLVDVVMASAALPGAFGHYSIVDPEQGVKRHYVDGGLWANAPMLAAVVLAIEKGASLADIRVVSLGTASSTAAWKPAEYSKVKVMSKDFFRCLFDIASSAAEETAREAVGRLIGWKNILHVDGLTQKQIAAWDVDAAVRLLPRVAADLAADHSDLDQLKKLVA